MIQSGIIVFNKDTGMTSHDAVGMIRRLTGIKRVGHGGTLDPMARGVLPIFIGKATRIIEYMSEGNDNEAKIYRATMKLGYETDTQDILGEETWRFDGEISFPTDVQISEVFNGFIGEQTQIPPSYSAVKYKGKRLYEYAREGKPVDEDNLKKRHIFIKDITVINCNPVDMEIEFDITCSGGTYIRTVCQDAGRLFGTGAVMSSLIRMKSGPFRIENSFTIDQLKEIADRNEDLPFLPMDSAIPTMCRIDISDENAKKFMNGVSFSNTETDESEIAVYNQDVFIGIAHLKNGIVKPHKVIK